MIEKEAWYRELEREAKRVSDSFISEYRDIISRYDDMFASLCDLEQKLSKKERCIWDGLSKESKDEVGNPKHYRAKLNAMQQWWSKHRPKGRANWPLTLPKDRKRAAQMIESELEVMDKILKYGEKELEKLEKKLEKKLTPEVTEKSENPPAPVILPDME